VIEVLPNSRHPFSLITKSAGVERDIDLIAPMAARRLAAVYVSITTLDPRWPASWSRAPPRPSGGCAPSKRWRAPACRWG
jgi:DNA repair photolyase